MRWCWLVILCVVVSGCRPGAPVEEISVSRSGVVLREVASDPALLASWPSWRGPQGNGWATTQEVRTQWSESEGVRWMSDVPGRGHASPIVVGDLVLLATAVDGEQKQRVLAYDKTSGEKLWDTVVHEGNFPSKRENHHKSTNANSTLASDGRQAYVAFFNDGKIFATALDLNGNQVWQKELGVFNSKFGFAPSPLLYKSFVIFTADHRGGGYLAALDAETGEIAWRIARDAKNSHSSPTIATVGGKEQLLISGCDRVASYDPATGEQLWSTSCLAETTCGTIVVDKDKVYASGGYPDRQTICLSADGKKIWENQTKIYEPSMLAVDDYLFAVSDDGIAYCWSGQEGNVLWRKRLGGNFSASPVLCNGQLYVSNLSGKTYVFQASPEGYREIAVNRLGTDCYASPAMVDGNIFLRVGFQNGGSRQEKLVCIGD